MARAPPSWDTVTRGTTFHGPCMPKDLGLRGSPDDCTNLDGRIYVLRCEPHVEGGPFTYYCGFSYWRLLKERLRIEMTQDDTAADFVKRNRPIQIEYLWPAPSPAAEAYVYYALLATLGCNAAAKGRVGGNGKRRQQLRRR